MSQENIQSDTQEQSVSLEETIFGNEDSGSDIESAFRTQEEEVTEQAAPEQGQPAQEEVQPSNDEKRFQYWQSQADKLKNENAQLRNLVANNAQTINNNAQQQAAAPQESADEFPPPPEKPARPRSFSREEAYSDPNSESARYLDAVEDWRDSTAEYNTVRAQYENALMQERFDKMEHQRIENVKRAQARQAAQQQMSNVKEHVMGHYGMDSAQADDFMAKMSDPRSLNIDNLVSLYRLQSGNAPANQQQAPAQPSDAFKQVQNAQQVPSPMGVMPSGNTNIDGRSAEDKIMDKLIGDFDAKNPWK